jgi:tetratricopeptide (TPR) repeat protein
MLNKVFASAALILLSALSFAQTADELVDQARQLEKQMKESTALSTFKDAIKVQPDNIAALTGASELSAREGARASDKEEKARNYTEAKSYAEQAIKLAPENADANYVMAVALGRTATTVGAKEKVAAYKEVKRYAELALKFNPKYAKAYYVLGKLNYDMVNMNALEKAAAKMLFGGLPEASLQDAIANYEKCRKLDPSLLLNYQELARAYKDNEELEKAIEVLRKAVTLRPVYQDDPNIKSTCRKMLEDLE